MIYLAGWMASFLCRCCWPVSEYLFERSRLVAAPPELMAQFFQDGVAWFRLNPEWEVLTLKKDANECTLKVRYERSEVEAEYRIASADFSETGGIVELKGDSPRSITLNWNRQDDKLTRLDYHEGFAEQPEIGRVAELNLWIDAAGGYLTLAARSDRKARLGRWLLDRFWLRMSPMSRRISLIIVGMEALALLLFIAILLIYKFFG
ncbi:MAG: hypothetical protein KKF85_04075 [Gammaproteobacteria bacterium]|nr:hypothetical protein [Rhodocyclaceae bacterium]MBU3910289.1 hypothetical protein [Gammaproteobacteria bacterium]MBU4004116.1 hypothetical protein [Gammaproteobacteria bacterium]MBU4020363.1 hypothetical protein [Gammaproteobacteria bacterium]MBU4095439.1 hypothetical protein [Gammaproteobacteria bacterium]